MYVTQKGDTEEVPGCRSSPKSKETNISNTILKTQSPPSVRSQANNNTHTSAPQHAATANSLLNSLASASK